MTTNLAEQRLLALFAAGCLLLNYPLLALWDRDAILFGVPLFPAALFLLWSALIAALAWIVEQCEDAAESDSHDSAPDIYSSPGTGSPPGMNSGIPPPG